MHLRHCRARPALTRPRAQDIAALHHAIRTFHISAPLSDESSSSGNGSSNNNNEPAPLGSARARSAVAGARIQNVAPRYSNGDGTFAPYKQSGLAGGVFPSGQPARQPQQQQGPRIIAPIRRVDFQSGNQTFGLGDGQPRTPRIQTRVGGGAGGGGGGGGGRFGGRPRPGGFGARSGGPVRGGPRRRPAKRGGNAVRGKGQRDDDEAPMSDTMLRHLVGLKAARRAEKTHTPHQYEAAELVSHASRSASLGQPGGGVQLLEARLRELAGRPLLDAEPIWATADRLLRGKFVKFADDTERNAVMEVVAERQAVAAAMLSELKGEEIEPRPVEFEAVTGPLRDATTDALVAGKYAVQEGEMTVAAAKSSQLAGRMLGLNGSYVGGDRGKFMGKLNALMSVQGAAAAAKKPAPQANA